MTDSDVEMQADKSDADAEDLKPADKAQDDSHDDSHDLSKRERAKRFCKDMYHRPCGVKKILFHTSLTILSLGVILSLVVICVGAYAGRTFVYIELPCSSDANNPANFQPLSTCPPLNIDLTPWHQPAGSWDNITLHSGPDASIALRGITMEGNSSMPTIVLTHGYDTCWRRYEVLLPACMLRNHGYNVVLFNLRNHGDSDRVNHGYTTFGVNESNDTLTAVEYAHTEFLGGKPYSQIGLVGTSMGGGTSYIAFGKQPALQGIWADSAVYDIYLALVAGFDEDAGSIYKLFSRMAFKFAEHYAGVNFVTGNPSNWFYTYTDRYVHLEHSYDDDLVYFKNAQEALAAGEKADAKIDYHFMHTGTVNSTCNQHLALALKDPQGYEQRLIAFFDKTFGITR